VAPAGHDSACPSYTRFVAMTTNNVGTKGIDKTKAAIFRFEYRADDNGES
jgi:hypothetical protein